MRSEAPRYLALRWSPILALIGTCVASLILLRAELTQVPYLNDSAVHEEMVRFALAKFRSGHFPLDSWFPYLNLGSPQFLHYQSLAAMLTALVAWGIGVGHAFTITTWLLVSCWPICIYGAARVFGLRRSPAMAAAILSPFLSSATGVGYEQISYLWAGYGLWSQLFAMWTLPFAWAFSWRAIEERRCFLEAAVLVAATAAFHFETGYLAFVGVMIFIVVRPTQLLMRTGRAFVVTSGALALSAWAIVPLVAQGKWAAVNQFLQSGDEGVDANSYGARRVLSWLVSGNLFDWHHLPIITTLFAIGVVTCLSALRQPRCSISIEHARALVLVFAGCLVLFFGRPTFGPLFDVLPGAENLFLRRFIVGVELAGLFLAGIGIAQLITIVGAIVKRILARRGVRYSRLSDVLTPIAIACCSLGVLVPAWSFVATSANRNASLIAEQSLTDRPTLELNGLIAIITKRGGGRTFAGDPSDWGAHFTVGEVPVFKYLASKDIDEVGFTLRTASLMSDPENEFDDTNPSDYALFGIRWLILPTTMPSPVPADLVEVRGTYSLWEIPTDGYVTVVDARGSLAATSSDLGSFSAALLRSLPLSDPILPTVAYEGGTAAAGTLGGAGQPLSVPGTVRDDRIDLVNGTVEVSVSLTRTAVVLLSASYDPGWQVIVDGRPARTEMVAPALVGVRVGPGDHTVRFVYHGYPDYPQLFTLGAVALCALIVIERRSKSRRPS